jgi:hypothetical protein
MNKRNEDLKPDKKVLLRIPIFVQLKALKEQILMCGESIPN